MKVASAGRGCGGSNLDHFKVLVVLEEEDDGLLVFISEGADI
jgi:hypothetical protein